MLISAVFFIAPTPARAETLAQNPPTMRALRADDLSPYVDATTALSHGHVARVYAEEDLNTIVYRNLDGTKTAYFFDYNVKYVDENGATKDKDITLATKAGGFGLTQSDISLTIPTDITNGVEFSHNGNYIKLTPLRESIIEESLSSSAAALNKPQSAVKDTAKNEISYQKAFGNNTSLRYVPTIDGIKEEIILSSYTGTTAWRFLATTNGLTPYKDASGIYYFATAEDSDERYSLGEVYTYDSVGNYTYGTMDVVEVKPAQQYIITLNVDEEFLTADSTVYPVYVDPSINIPSEGLYDTTVYSNYATTNYGTNPKLQIGRYVENNINYGIARVALKAQNLVNNGTFYYYMDTIVDATLTLYFESNVESKPITMHRINNMSWTETNATWNSVGTSFNTSAEKTFTPTYGLNYIDITGIVSSWKANQNLLLGGILLKNSDETNSSSCHKLYSNEFPASIARPTLTIQYKTDIDDHFNTDWITTAVGTTKSIVRSQLYANYVTYSSRNTNIASVSSTGVVTGVANGVTYIDGVVARDGNFDGDFNDSGDDYYEFDCKVIICPIPVSGYELDYSPGDWNVSPIQESTNCYAYAVNAQVVPPNISDNIAILQPGLVSDVDDGYTLEDLFWDISMGNIPVSQYLDYIVGYFMDDAEHLNKIAREIEPNQLCASGNYKVALVLSSSDYHWYRQNPDGTWSHKRGTTAVTNLDDSGNIIYDPRTCDRNYSYANYSTFVGFFEVEPWNYMYLG